MSSLNLIDNHQPSPILSLSYACGSLRKVLAFFVFFSFLFPCTKQNGPQNQRCWAGATVAGGGAGTARGELPQKVLSVYAAAQGGLLGPH